MELYEHRLRLEKVLEYLYEKQLACYKCEKKDCRMLKEIDELLTLIKNQNTDYLEVILKKNEMLITLS